MKNTQEMSGAILCILCGTFYPTGQLASCFWQVFSSLPGGKSSIILLCSFSSVGGSAVGLLPRRLPALPEPLIFLCWQNRAVFCPDSSALGSLCKRSFQSSYSQPSTLLEICGGERCGVDVALLDSCAEPPEALLNFKTGFISTCDQLLLITTKAPWVPSARAVPAASCWSLCSEAGWLCSLRLASCVPLVPGGLHQPHS